MKTEKEIRDRLSLVSKEYGMIREAYFREPKDSPKLKLLDEEWVTLRAEANALRWVLRSEE